MLKVQTKIDKNVSLELSKDAYLVYLIMAIIGGVGMLAYLVLLFVLPEGTTWIDWLMFFTIPLGAGIGFIYILKRNLKFAELNEVENIYEFDELMLKVTTLKDGRIAANYMVEYADIVNRKETESYLFLFLSKTSAFAVGKKGLTDLEILEIKALTGFNIKKEEINLGGVENG